MNTVHSSEMFATFNTPHGITSLKSQL